MFRSIESIYKANRALLTVSIIFTAKETRLTRLIAHPEIEGHWHRSFLVEDTRGPLNEMGKSLSSAIEVRVVHARYFIKIVDLDAPYTKYATNFCSGFDTWEPVQSNERLRTTLAMFSGNNPPPSTEEHPSQPPLWTLDGLFLVPKYRLKYYHKLYSRLLKSTSPGRSDHKLLSSALDKLDSLLSTLDQNAAVRVDGGQQPLQMGEDEVVIDLRMRDSTLPLPPAQRTSDSTHGSSSPSV